MFSVFVELQADRGAFKSRVYGSFSKKILFVTLKTSETYKKQILRFSSKNGLIRCPLGDQNFRKSFVE